MFTVANGKNDSAAPESGTNTLRRTHESTVATYIHTTRQSTPSVVLVGIRGQIQDW